MIDSIEIWIHNAYEYKLIEKLEKISEVKTNRYLAKYPGEDILDTDTGEVI